MRDVILAVLLVNILGCSSVPLMHAGPGLLLIVGIILFLSLLAGLAVGSIYAAEGMRCTGIMVSRWHGHWCARWEHAEFRASVMRTVSIFALPVGTYVAWIYFGLAL